MKHFLLAILAAATLVGCTGRAEQSSDDYIDDMTLGANFATLNHLLINLQVLNAFQEVFPGVQGKLVYYISHNIAKREVVDGSLQWVHRLFVWDITIIA